MNCHIAIIGQDFAEVDYWVLGDIFNYNFYTSFDAENTPRIGLAKQLGAGVGATFTPTPVDEPYVPSSGKSSALRNVCVVIIVGVLAVLLLYVMCRCQESSKQRAA